MSMNIDSRTSSSQAQVSLSSFLDKLATNLGASIENFVNDIDAMVYKGFDAEKTRELAKATFAPEGVLRLVTIGALRGSAAVSLQVKSGGDPSLHALSIQMANGPPKTITQLFTGRQLYCEKNSTKAVGKSFLGRPCTTSDHLTIQRLVAAFPDMAAYGLHLVMQRGSLSKRVQTDLPPWMIFPAAASLPFSSDAEPKVKDMCQKFSNLIGGTFDESIYKLQRANPVKFGDNVIHRFLVDAAMDQANITLEMDFSES
jgi:hypothetical protein